MHILLTDRLVCPRCGPGFGLILRAEQLEDRRVEQGELGCANCRERYPIVEGRADLRPPPRAPLPTPVESPAIEGEGRTQAFAAVLGAAETSRPILLLDAAAAWMDALVRTVPHEGPEWVVATAGPAPAAEDGAPVSAVIHGPVLPFTSGSFGGVGLSGPSVDASLLREAVRVLGPGGRVGWIAPPDDARVRLGGAGLTRFIGGEGLAAGSR